MGQDQEAPLDLLDVRVGIPLVHVLCRWFWMCVCVRAHAYVRVCGCLWMYVHVFVCGCVDSCLATTDFIRQWTIE